MRMLLEFICVVAASASFASGCSRSFIPSTTLEAGREACTKACNEEGFCCNNNGGGCQKVTCSVGCHIAYFSESEAACIEQCKKANVPGCFYYHPVSGIFAKCWEYSECGCPADVEEQRFGFSQKFQAGDCSPKACEAGCTIAKTLFGHPFYGRSLTAQEEAVACGDHGEYDAGECVCTDGYMGDGCNTPPASCKDHSKSSMECESACCKWSDEKTCVDDAEPLSGDCSSLRDKSECVTSNCRWLESKGKCKPPKCSSFKDNSECLSSNYNCRWLESKGKCKPHECTKKPKNKCLKSESCRWSKEKTKCKPAATGL